ncbi:MAG: DMP19 family protein [Paludibacteraceae bacterium]|nr:DMP19 family protein [Paludibacteraceae bacterium]
MIQIQDQSLKNAIEEGMDEFLQVFIDAYIETLGGELSPGKMALLNGSQHSLLAWHFFSTEMRDGGFVQLIQNGYGPYIFENPFAKAMRQFGCVELSKLIYKAKEIYDANKKELTRETTEEEFNAMYVDFEIFDELEERYFDMEEEQTSLLAAYVDEHIQDFAEIVE